MIVQHFLKWVESARVAERTAAANALARAFIVSDLEFEDRCAAEAALTLLLDDPSPKVRMAMAEGLAMSRRAPEQVIAGLAQDQDDIAALVISRSPLLSDSDLIDRVALSGEKVQSIIALRPRVSMALSAAIAEVGEAQACIDLLSIPAPRSPRSASSASPSVSPRRRACVPLLDDRRLPAETRHALLMKIGEALRDSGLVQALMGRARAERITREACVKASLKLTDTVDQDEHPALVEHLRMRGDVTPSFIVRVLAYGKIDFFGAIIVSLTGQPFKRVQAILAEGRDMAVLALFRKAGLPSDCHTVLTGALKIWRDVARGKRDCGPQEVMWSMLEQARKDVAASPARPTTTASCR
ncbi:MAG: DUF2336 domain-containing protein [Brucellaceae bacterium]|nr:DUF2336 domain-containing protein [Brucellaceae bacterium]